MEDIGKDREHWTLSSHFWVSAGATVCFLVCAGYFLLSFGPDSDTTLYVKYASVAEADGIAGLYKQYDVEYPPLAIGTMLAAHTCARVLPSGSDPVVRTVAVYRTLMLGAYTLAFFLILGVLGRFFLGEPTTAHLERLAAFLVGSYLLRHFLFNRLDLALGALMLLAVVLVLSRVHYLASFLVLALSIDFKVVPIILAPVCVLASLPSDAIAGVRSLRGAGKLGLLCLGRCVLLAGLVVAFLVPFYLLAGPRCLEFLAYHKDRGIEFESTYASLLAVLKSLGYRTNIHPMYGSCDVDSAISPFLTRLAPLLTLGLLVAVALLLVRALIRVGPSRRAGTLGQARPDLFISGTFLVLAVFIFANKVFSPQYVLWLLPLAPLVPLPALRRRVFLGLFLALCALTYLICPRYMADVLAHTPFGAALLVSRTLVLLALVVILVGPLLRRAQLTPLPFAPPSPQCDEQGRQLVPPLHPA
jgi:hypothetical protein